MNLAQASKSKLFQVASFSSSHRPYLIVIDKKLATSANNLINFTLEKSTAFSATDINVLKESNIFSNSELANLSGAEITQATALRKFYQQALINSDFLFLNEKLYIIHPILTSSKKN